MIQDTGYRILDTGYWIQDTGYSILDTGYWIQDTGYRIQDTGYRILNTRYWIQDTGNRILSFSERLLDLVILNLTQSYSRIQIIQDRLPDLKYWIVE